MKPALVQEALKPALVQESQQKAGVKSKNKNKRHNDGYVRQGEWFFIPENVKIDECLILRNERLERSGGGKPHIAEEAYRTGGEIVWIGRGKVLSPEQFQALRRVHPESVKYGIWRQQIRNPKVYVRGKIKHPDHKTVELNVWHQVVPNTERGC